MQGKITTVQQHILDEERMHPEATGDFTALLTTLTLAAKIISREVNKAGLVKILGDTGEINVQGEAVQKLDEFAQHTICRAMGHNGHLCVMASEESEDIIPIPDGSKRGKYVLMFDPLDGSSNIDVNASIGTRRRRLAGRLPAKGLRAGRRRLLYLRLEHNDGLHDRKRRARIYA